jgi:hypothetical protein
MFKKPIKVLDARKVKKFSRVDFSVCQKLNRDLVARAKELSQKLKKYESVIPDDLDRSTFFDESDIQDAVYIFISEFEFDCAYPFVGFRTVDDYDSDYCAVAEISINLLMKTDEEIDKLVEKAQKKLDKIEAEKRKAEDKRAAEIKDAKEKKEYKEFLRLKKKFEGAEK